MSRPLVLTALSLALLLGACTLTGELALPAVDLDAEREALLETDRALAAAYTTSDSPLDTIFESFAPDARVLAPDGPMVEGWEACRALFAELEALPGYALSYEPTLADVSESGDMGYTIGTYRMQLPGEDGGLVTVHGKYLTLWKREPGGRWLIAVDMFNANGPPVPVETAGDDG